MIAGNVNFVLTTNGKLYKKYFEESGKNGTFKWKLKKFHPLSEITRDKCRIRYVYRYFTRNRKAFQVKTFLKIIGNTLLSNKNHTITYTNLVGIFFLTTDI